MGPRVNQVYKVPWWENTPSVMLQGALQRHKNSKQIFPEKEMRGPSPHFHIHVPVCNLYIPTIGLPILLQENMRTDLGIIIILTGTWAWKLGLRQSNSFSGNTYSKWTFHCSAPGRACKASMCALTAPGRASRAPRWNPRSRISYTRPRMCYTTF